MKKKHESRRKPGGKQESDGGRRAGGKRNGGVYYIQPLTTDSHGAIGAHVSRGGETKYLEKTCANGIPKKVWQVSLEDLKIILTNSSLIAFLTFSESEGSRIAPLDGRGFDLLEEKLKSCICQWEENNVIRQIRVSEKLASFFYFLDRLSDEQIRAVADEVLERLSLRRITLSASRRIF